MASGRYELSLLGVPRLVAPSGEDVTPRLRKSQALLAILALAEERPMSRAQLQQLLWHDRMPQQARDSLKKALGELRRAFRDATVPPLESDGGPVVLRLSGLEVDALSGAAPRGRVYTPRLLEGLDLSDPPFVAWRERMRARIEGPVAGAAGAVAPPEPSMHFGRPIAIGLAPVAPTAPAASGDIDAHLEKMIRRRLARTLRQTGSFDVIDMSGPGEGAEAVPDLRLSVSVTGLASQTLVDVRLASVDGRREVWSTTEAFETARIDLQAVSVLLQTMADQICEKVRLTSWLFSDRHVASRAALVAVSQLFRLSEQDIATAERLLKASAEQLGSSPVYAACAYVTAFQVEKSGRRTGAIADEAEHYSALALELDPTNPLTRALVSHVQSFVLRDLDRAGEILEPVGHLAGTNLMLADAIGLLHFYRGDYDRAHRHAALACDLGRWNRFRYAFTTSLSMCQLMQGDHHGAIASGRRAIAQHPMRARHVFEPTLRTLASAHALAGDRDEGRSVIARLDRQNGAPALAGLAVPDEARFPNLDTFRTDKRSLEILHG